MVFPTGNNESLCRELELMKEHNCSYNRWLSAMVMPLYLRFWMVKKMWRWSSLALLAPPYHCQCHGQTSADQSSAINQGKVLESPNHCLDTTEAPPLEEDDKVLAWNCGQ
jgi:hypothetical protein